jgi:hypothetical protein
MESLRNVIRPNIPALEAVKHIVYTASGSLNYHTHYDVVDAYADVAPVCAALNSGDVFPFNTGRGGSTGESVSYSPDV